ncbi:ABC transporter ATP-binding protein [Shewanella woodyi]|uniref:ABC transporter ATP-binding protein n=1 Tax=Shewanella woodyi TaxID=60961 RepID=UPI00374943A3
MVKVIAQNIEMRFGERRLFAVKRVQLSQGQTVHLQGDNGSGKTTLMKMLAGLIAPTKGKVTTQGFAPLPWWRSNSLLGKAVYLHQHPYLFDGTVEYNLRYPHPFCTMSKQLLEQRTHDAIEKAGLTHLTKQAASSLSGGERQRLAIARAWIMQPKLLMLDEPTSNMDTYSQELVLAMVKDLQQLGSGMLVSSHQSCALTGLCDQSWRIENQGISSSLSDDSCATKTSPQTSLQEPRYVIAN